MRRRYPTAADGREDTVVADARTLAVHQPRRRRQRRARREVDVPQIPRAGVVGRIRQGEQIRSRTRRVAPSDRGRKRRMMKRRVAVRVLDSVPQRIPTTPTSTSATAEDLRGRGYNRED